MQSRRHESTRTIHCNVSNHSTFEQVDKERERPTFTTCAIKEDRFSFLLPDMSFQDPAILRDKNIRQRVGELLKLAFLHRAVGKILRVLALAP